MQEKIIMNYITNLFLVVAIGVYSLVRGKATKTPPNIKKIIVIQNAKLGDMVCSTPVFRAIKNHIPNAYIVVMGDKINKELLRGNSDVDEYIIFEKKFFKLLKKIRLFGFDFGCVLTPDSYSFALLFLGGVKAITLPEIKNGFSPWETKTYKIMRKSGIPISHFMGSYAPREYLRLLEPIGIFTDNTKKHLAFSAEADKKTAVFLKKEGISSEFDFVVGISPSSGNKIKKWSEENFAKVADYLYKKYQAKIIIIGGPNDKEDAERMVSFLNKDTRFINAFGVFNIDELKALISKIGLFISVDTGPIYIAEAFGVPTIDIIGPVDEREQPPVGTKRKIVYLRDRKEAAIHILNARMYDYAEAKRQIDEITTDMVFKEIDDIMSDIRNIFELTLD